MKKAILLLLSFTLFSCAHNQDAPIEQQSKPTQAIKSSEQNIIEPKLNIPDDISKKAQQANVVFFDIGVIPGNLYGNPLPEPRWYTDLYTAAKPTLNITEIEHNFSLFAQPLNSNTYTANLVVSPSNTKLVRASTFGIDLIDEQYLSGGLKHENGDFLLLVYFDQACTIKGLVDFGIQGVFNHDINVPKAGLYTLIIDKDNNVTATQDFKSLIIYLESAKSTELTKN